MKLLNEYIESMRDKAWESGRNDCALFCAGWIKAATGEDYAEGYAGRYSSTEEGLELIGSLHDYAAERLGGPITILEAKRGDIAYRTSDGGETVGVVIGRRVACPGDDGLYLSDIDEWECAFPVSFHE